MTTLSQLIYDLWMAQSPDISDDSIVDERVIKFWIHNQRALWLRNDFNKNREIDDNVIQDLGAVPVIIDDRVWDNSYIQDKKILRTNVKIPVTIERYDGPTLTRIGALDIGVRPFKLIDYTRLPFVGNGKFNKLEIFTFLLNGYIYIVSHKDNPITKVIKYINVRGVFENPEEVSTFNTLNGTPCYTDESPYPVNKWMIEYMKDAIIKADLRYYMSPNGMDLTNDASPIEGNNSQPKPAISNVQEAQ